MRFFDLWGIPNDTGDIESYDYLFLGDYVDRGAHSLETICLLMALKVKFPDKIHLLRGNHEDKWINNAFGFAEECSSRLGEDPNDPDSVFAKINDLFDWLPLAAVIAIRSSAFTEELEVLSTLLIKSRPSRDPLRSFTKSQQLSSN